MKRGAVLDDAKREVLRELLIEGRELTTHQIAKRLTDRTGRYWTHYRVLNHLKPLVERRIVLAKPRGRCRSAYSLNPAVKEPLAWLIGKLDFIEGRICVPMADEERVEKFLAAEIAYDLAQASGARDKARAFKALYEAALRRTDEFRRTFGELDERDREAVRRILRERAGIEV